MIIIDNNGKERNVSYAKQITHNRKNDSIAFKHENVKGELKLLGEQQIVETDEQYVQVEIIGKHGTTWIEWYPLENFEKRNPTVKL